MTRNRVWAFGALSVAAALLAVGYATVAVRRASTAASNSPTIGPSLATPPERPFLLVRSTAQDQSWRRLVAVPLAGANGPGFVTSLLCDRAYFAGKRGVCLLEESGLVTRYYADIFDEQFTRQHRIPLSGLPSRVRVSADGRRAGITVFEQGHSYAVSGFSTRTAIIDTDSGREIAELEQFTVRRDGRPFSARDFNFWGVTFTADANRFLATLASGGVKYLVEGNVDTREATVLRTGVECPSISPDETRIAYKAVIPRDGGWSLRMYDLKTGVDSALAAETRSVDDQVEWLDNHHVMYHIPGPRDADVWVLRVDATEPPTLLREYAYSPAIVR